MGDTFSDSYTCWNCLLKRLLHFAFTIWRAVPIWLASSGASIATFSSELLPTSTLFSPWPELGPTLHLQLPAHHLQPHSRLRAPAALSEPTMASTTKPPHFSPSLTNDNMNTKRRIMSSPSLRLLDLPRELRDMVYGFTLVRDHIEVASPKRRVADPNLAVFLTNRQGYQEATEVFYSRNNFRFTSSGLTKIPSVATCLAFLKDRSGTKYIKSLTLALEPYSNVMFGTLNSAVIQNDSTIIGLINCINTSLPQLEHLGLTFNGRPLDVRQLPWEINGDSYSVSQMPLLWIKHLFTLRKLKSLYIRHRCDEKFGDPACLVAFVSLLRAHLLVNGEHLGTQNIRKHNRHCAYLGNDGLWARKSTRIYEVECYDDEAGESLLEPVARKYPLRTGALAKDIHDSTTLEQAKTISRERRLFEEFFAEDDTCRIFTILNERYGFRSQYFYGDIDVESEESDWEFDDASAICGDWDTDSLNSLGMDGQNTEWVRDERYFDTCRITPES